MGTIITEFDVKIFGIVQIAELIPETAEFVNKPHTKEAIEKVVLLILLNQKKVNIEFIQVVEFGNQSWIMVKVIKSIEVTSD